MTDDASPAAREWSAGLVDSIADPVVVFDEAGRLRRWNRALVEATGYTDETLSSLSLDRLFGDADHVREVVTAVPATGRTTFDATLRTAAGDAVPDADDPATAVVCVGRDVTEARRRQRELERAEVVLESLADAVYAIESDGTIAYVNDRYVDMKGVSREELLGTDIDDWVTEATVEQADELRAAVASGDRDVGTVEYEFVTGDGERFPAELRFGPVGHPDSDLGRVGMIRDVTERVERERTLRRQNERLDEFASIVSHDLRNPLNVAEGWLELAREECDSDHLDSVTDAHDRMRRLVGDLLTLARQGQTEPEPTHVSLRELAEECWRSVDRRTATLVVETDATVHADERQLRRLVENLLRNAVEHGSTNPRSQARGDAVEHGSASSRPAADDSTDGSDSADGDAVTVTVGGLPDGFFVADGGPGVPPRDRERVFETGYSTSAEGTGFGLRIVREVAQAHGWDVSVTESDGGGARFEIRGADVD
ncbi:PAS domain S-box protein [Salinigranum marinum]|uniref:PAS domain S-box protein n=1 Tax=Salinigranum marinum TaxID=1515595 RepID=UPI002989A638|nr:PAS domain S-box protein [Salinigranum marinum]